MQERDVNPKIHTGGQLKFMAAEMLPDREEPKREVVDGLVSRNDGGVQMYPSPLEGLVRPIASNADASRKADRPNEGLLGPKFNE